MNAARPGDRRSPAAESTQRIPAAPTEQLPRADVEPTRQLPASHTESIPETDPSRPTRAIRQVRRRAEEGPWPAIPMLPVIKPDDGRSPVERVRDHRGVQALRDYLDRDPDAPAWPERP